MLQLGLSAGSKEETELGHVLRFLLFCETKTRELKDTPYSKCVCVCV